MYRFFILLLTLFGLHVSINSSLAASSDWQGIDETQVRLLSASSTLGDGQNLVFGLHFKMQENWKVYWRSPGDAGFPPELVWSDPENRMSSEILWPRPERFEVLGLETLGYKDEVIYPVAVNVANPSKDLSAKAELNFLTCSDICVPVTANLSINIAAGEAAFSDNAQLINQFKSQVPLKGENSGVNWIESTVFKHENGKDGVLRVVLNANWALSNPDAIAEGPVELIFQHPKITKDQDQYMVDFPFDGLQFMEKPLNEADFILTLMDDSRSVELTGPFTIKEGVPTSSTAPETNVQNEIPLIQILLFALIGGLILNVMPCVLPVLSIKVLGVINQGGAETKTVRSAFLASTAGILFSFMVLAGILISLKSAGAAIGWGIQFQEPLFLIGLSIVIILFACNLWGLFEVSLPSGLSSVSEVEAKQKSPIAKHFLSGAFATILATPCSAPFLGTAVGFALSRGTGEILMVFFMLGIGLALPYILLALNPSWVNRFPKPGPWMVKVRFVLGFALLATAVWLVSVLFAQIGMNATLVIAGILASIILILAFKQSIGKIAVPLIIAIAATSFIVPSTIANTKPDVIAGSEDHWQTFRYGQIPELVAAGNIVFVDVTADWCITCQVNKKVVMAQNPVLKELQSDQVVALKADWTSPNQDISDYLASYGRYGIPFNAVYGPSAPNGIALPEILTDEIVMDAIKQAK